MQIIFYKLKGCPACNHVQPTVEKAASDAGINLIIIDGTTDAGRANCEANDIEDFPILILKKDAYNITQLKGVNKIKRELPLLLPQKKNGIEGEPQPQESNFKKYLPLAAAGLALLAIGYSNYVNTENEKE